MYYPHHWIRETILFDWTRCDVDVHPSLGALFHLFSLSTGVTLQIVEMVWLTRVHALYSIPPVRQCD